jgi:hypothetical protein
MGMSDGMEDRLMDDEIRSALELTKEELLDRAAKGEPARVARSDPRRRAPASGAAGAITMESDLGSIVIKAANIEGRAVKLRPPSVTVG